MKTRLLVGALLLLVALALVGCASTRPALVAPTSPTPALPKLGDPLQATNGMTVTVLEHTTFSTVPFVTRDGSERRSPASGNTYHVVSAELKVASDPLTMTLNLDNIDLISPDNHKAPAVALTYRSDMATDVSELAFLPVGEDGKTLDFGLGFTGMNMKQTTETSRAGAVRLLLHHGASPIILTFLYEVPEASQAQAFQFNDMTPVQLTGGVVK